MGKGKTLRKLLTKPIEDLANAPISERLIQRQLNAGGIIALTGATMGVSTVGAMMDSSKPSKLGKVSIEENLDRLVSIDGSGFVEQANQLSGGDPEIMSDIVKHSFNSPNQWGASGDLVFALHNRREG